MSAGIAAGVANRSAPQIENAYRLPGLYGVAETFALATAPTAIDYRARPATSIRMTQSATSIQRARSRRWDVSIQGESALDYRLGFDRHGAPIFQPGDVLHEELIQWLQRFLDAHIDGEDVLLTFHDFLNGRQLWVEPVSLTLGRDDQHRIHPKWSFELQGYALAGYPNAGFAGALAIVPQIRDKLRTVDRWANTLSAGAQIIEATIESLLDIVRATGDLFGFVPNLIHATADVVDSAAALVAYPAEFWYGLSDDVRAASAELSSAMRRIDLAQQDLEQLLNGKQALYETEHDTAVAVMALSADRGVAGTGSAKAYVMQAGDTLQSVAAQVLGNAGRWTDIVELNGLTPPYVSAGGLPGTATVGTELLLPVDAVLPADIGQDSSGAPSDVDLFGTDLLLVDGDLVAEPGDDPADIQLVSGEACLIQGLEDVLFRTTQGESRSFPVLGLAAAVGDPNYHNAGFVLAQLVDQILLDDRIASVRNEAAEEIRNGLALRAEIVVRTGRKATIGKELTT